MLIYILCGTILVLGICVIIFYRKSKRVVEINNARYLEQARLEQEIKNQESKIATKRQELESVQTQLANTKISVESQNNVLTSLTATSERLRQEACNRAEESFKARTAALEYELKEKRRNAEAEIASQNKLALDAFESKKLTIQAELDRSLAQLAQEKEKLAILEAKQLAYIQAQQRQEKISQNQDYYRLALDVISLNDITLLRDLQKHFSKKDVIDKLIWDYYKPAYDLLMSRISETPGKICGIYRLTDTVTGQSYVGQSVDIRERLRSHIKAGLAYGPASNKLYQAMQKDGPENFIFEILEEVPREQLNEREKYWIGFYHTQEYGMNATKGNQ